MCKISRFIDLTSIIIPTQKPLKTLVLRIQHFQGLSYLHKKIGVTGFEPATSRPPAVRSSQTEPYPASKHKIFISCLSIVTCLATKCYLIFQKIYEIISLIRITNLFYHTGMLLFVCTVSIIIDTYQ